MNFNAINERLDALDIENPYSMMAIDKSAFLFDLLKELSIFHSENCSGYNNFLGVIADDICNWTGMGDVAAVPVRIFKMHDLYSVDFKFISKTLTSSGTSGKGVSKIFLDTQTARRQTRILAAITKNFVGKYRIPMVIADNVELLRDRTKLNARAAGILGYSVFGRNHFYCLNKDLNVDVSRLSDFLAIHNKGPILIFGFTFVIWQSLVQFSINNDIKFDFGDRSILIHGGGWKKLEDQKVDNSFFKELSRKRLGIRRVHNYYGMVEQVGSVFMECSNGYLHCPDFAEVIIRDPLTLDACGFGQEGVIQVLSILPVSYPGHSLLTEDLGIAHGEDDCSCGRRGKYFTVSGRMPMSELRGCSDTRII